MIFVGLLAVAGVAISYTIGIVPRYDSDYTLHSPVFSADGGKIYIIERTVKGISWGPGIEFFSPPAKVVFLSDRFRLDSVDLATGKVRPLYAWTVSHEKTIREEYRNRLS